MTARLPARFSVATLLLAAVACSSSSTPLPSNANSGFDIDRDAFKFENFGAGYDAAQIDTDLAVRMFGEEAVCVPGSSPCQATADAQAWMDTANENMVDGHCEGLAVLSQLFYLKALDPAAFGAPTARELVLDENYKLQRELAYWFATQLVPGAAKNKALMPKDAVPFMAEFLKAGAAESYRIGMVQKTPQGFGSAHSLTPIGFAKGENENVYYISVYDNDRPLVQNSIRLDVAQNTWEYQGLSEAGPVVYTGGAAQKNPLYFAPVKSRMAKLKAPFGKGDTRTILVRGASPVVTDAQGRETGIKNGEVVEGNGTVDPGFSVCSGASAPVMVTANTKASDPVLVALAPTSGTNSSLNVAGGSLGALSLKGSLATTGTGQVQVSADSVKVQPGGAGSVTAEFKIDNVTVKLSVSGSTADSNLTVSRDPATGQISVTAANTPGGSIQVELQKKDEKTGETVSTSYTAPSSAGNTSVAVTPSAWTGSAPPAASVSADGAAAKPVAGSTCNNRTKDGDETDVDCGGACAPCGTGLSCKLDKDCQAGSCSTSSSRNPSTCQSACNNGKKDGDESDVDCGTNECGFCANGKSCVTTANCQGGDCINAVCYSRSRIEGRGSGFGTFGGTRDRTASFTVTAPVPGGSPRTQTFEARDGYFASSWVESALIGIVSSYSIEITQQPEDRACTITKGASGTIPATVGIAEDRSITGLEVTCVNAPSPCKNGVKDVQETDVDCGGPDCSPIGRSCGLGKACIVDRDCGAPSAVAICDAGRCVTTFSLGGDLSTTVPVEIELTPKGTLTDPNAVRKSTFAPNNVKFNFDNTRITGPWSIAVTPQTGVSCVVSRSSGTLAATNRLVGTVSCTSCGNGVRDGFETDVDCGGRHCTRENKLCGAGQKCANVDDCGSHNCDATTRLCVGSCADGAKNGNETDVDCGGACVTEGKRCALTKACTMASDCVTGAECTGNVCTPGAACTDGTKNGTETDVDCGGACAASPTNRKCALTKACTMTSDCVDTLVCTGNVCVPAPTCSDGAKNGTETDVDCGGSCSGQGKGCAGGKACMVAGDCLSNVCTSNTCAAPTTWAVVAATTFGAPTTSHRHGFAFAADDISASGGDVVGHYDGNAWTTQNPFVGSLPIQAMHAAKDSFSRTLLWVGSTDNILKFFNGTSWVSPTSNAGATTSWNGLHGVSPAGQSTTLFAVGTMGAIAKWDGTNFSTGSGPGGPGGPGGPPCTSSDLNAVFVVDSNLAWAVGNAGAMCVFGGGMWTTSSSGTSSNLRGIWAASATDAWAVGDGGTVVHWTGTSWSPVTSGTTQGLSGVVGTDASTVLFVGAAGTVRRWNGSSIVGETSNTTKDLRTVFTDATSVWAMGADNTFLRRN